jgi:hypothetical protein
MEKLLKLLILPHDKALHALYGLLAYSTMTIFIYPIVAFILVSVIAMSKELYDLQNSKIHTPDIYDAVYTIMPPAFVMSLEYLYRLV